MSQQSRRAKIIARRYHDGWSTGHFDEAEALLADDVIIEVPINDYPTRASFARAVASFAQMVEDVQLLSELGDADEALLLYDLRVRGLGPLRIAEHFTVKDGRIVRIRQIHDTAAIRAMAVSA